MRNQGAPSASKAPESDNQDVASPAFCAAVKAARVAIEEFVQLVELTSLAVPGNADERQIPIVIHAHQIELGRKDVIESLRDLDAADVKCFATPFITVGSLRDRIHKARKFASQAISAITIEYPNKFDRSALEAQMRERLSSGKRTHRTPSPWALHGAAQLALLSSAAKALAGCVEAATPAALPDAPAGPESAVAPGDPLLPVGEGPTKPRAPRYEWLARAMLLVKEHPEYSDRRIARAVKIDPSQLSRSKEYKAAAALARGQKEDIPRGSKNGITGDLEAEAESRDID